MEVVRPVREGLMREGVSVWGEGDSMKREVGSVERKEEMIPGVL